jgi:hypothetical protein
LLFARITVSPALQKGVAQAGSIFLMKSETLQRGLKNLQLSYYRHRHLDIARSCDATVASRGYD